MKLGDMIKGLSKEDALVTMNSIAEFNKIVKNYLKICKLESKLKGGSNES